jgi:hypothetical protein
MNEATPARVVDRDPRSLARIGGIAAIAIGLSYLAITALYAVAGAPPRAAETWLLYLGGRTTAWWAITGLSVLTDVLFLLVSVALSEALRSINRTAALIGPGLLALFAILDLAVTWPNFAALIVLSGDYAAAANDTQRAASIAAAGYPAAVLASGLFPVYAILVPALGILVIGLATRRDVFGTAASSLGVLTGVLGIVAVAGPYLWSPLGAVVILTSVLTTIWVIVIGLRLLRLGRRRPGTGSVSPDT